MRVVVTVIVVNVHIDQDIPKCHNPVINRGFRMQVGVRNIQVKKKGRRIDLIEDRLENLRVRFMGVLSYNYEAFLLCPVDIRIPEPGFRPLPLI